MTRVLSKPSIFSQLYYRTEDHSTQSISISEIIYTAEPDSVIELDIYLLDTLYSGINNIMYNENPIKVFPNPVSLNQKLNVNVELPTMTSNIWLELFDIDGKLILKQKIYQKDNLLKMPLTEGSYIICVLLDNRVISSNRVLVTSE